jgi:KaiC/GvpD/RAD55 family RecA-like ATPase
MPLEVHVPIFSDLVPGGFTYGANYLVEFDPNSLWYETSLTIAAKALIAGVRTQYHVFMHIPGEARQELQKLGADLKKLEKENRFRLIDSYTGLAGLPIQPEPGVLNTGLPNHPRFSLNDPSYLEKYTAVIVTILKEGAPETDKRWLHIDDNTSIFNRYFKEQDVLNIFQTRVFQQTRLLELSAFHSIVTGVWSEAFYKQFEAQCDGVIDFKAEEDEGQLENYVRVTGEVVLAKPDEVKKKEIGISGWLKGPKKREGSPESGAGSVQQSGHPVFTGSNTVSPQCSQTRIFPINSLSDRYMVS